MSQWDDEIRRRLGAAALDPAREIDIAQELAQHLDDRYAELIATGVAPEAARVQTLEELREDTLMRRELSQIERPACDPLVSGDTRRRSLVADLLQDLRYAARTLRTSPGFAAVALFTLALGIGATTAIFSIIDAMLIRPLAYDPRSRLVQVFHADFSRDYFKPEAPEEPARLLPSFPTYQALQARNQVFDGIAWYSWDRLTLLDASPVERVSVAAVTPGFIELFDALPALGRWFVESDVGQPLTIISYGCWQRRFGGDPAIVGSSVRMVEGQRTIVGVLPEDFPFDPSTDFWIPLDASPWVHAGAGGDLMARLKPGVTVEQAQRNMQALTQQLRNEGILNSRASVEVRSLHEWTMRSTRGMLLLLLAAVGFVLLIACVNVAGLLIARGAGRSHEVAIRTSLGAGRSRLLRQLLTESVLLALLGGMAGTLLAWLTLNALLAVLPVRVPSEVQPTVDLRILGFALLISGVTGLLFGLMPALRISRTGFATMVKNPSRGTPRWRARTGTALVIVEVALALVLMAGAGLMLRSLHRVLSIDPGFEPERVLVLEAIPVMVGERQPQRARAFYAELIARVRRLPGVEAVGAIDTLPFWSWAYSAVEVDGPEHKKVDVSPRYVLPSYFQAMGVPVKLGRAFTGADRDGAPCTVVVNETTARRYWHQANPLGQRVRLNSESPWCEVMGVVSNVRHEGLEEAVMPEVYFSALQSDEVELTLVARVENPSALAPLARAQTANLTERALVERVTPFETLIARSVSRRRHRALLLSLVGGLGVLLAGVGIFGLTSYAVARRTPEIGVRMALGATPRRVVQTVLAGFVPAIVGGVALGLVGAWATTRLLTAFVFGITPTDPLTFGTVSLLLTVAALAACYLPARRALHVDPVVALRAE